MFPSSNLIENVIATSGAFEDHDLAEAFRQNNDAPEGGGWILLGQIFDFHFVADNPIEPFQPVIVMDGKRSMIPSDLSEAQLVALKGTLGEVVDPEYRARIGDLLWLQKKDIDAARIAVSAYIAAGLRVEHPENWTSAMDRYERGLRLARQIEPRGQLPVQVLAHLQARVIFYNGTDPLFFTCKALELLSEFRFGEFGQLAEIAERVAVASRQAGDFRRARSYYGVQAKLLRLGNRREEAENALVASAETLVEEAESRESAGAAMAAHIYWQEAIGAFRDRPSLRPRIPELQKRLAEAGKQTLVEMKQISCEVSIEHLVRETEDAFGRLPAEEALLKFVLYNQLIEPSQLRELALQTIRDRPLTSFFSASIYDEGGRKIGVRPAWTDSDEKTQELSISGFMNEHARIQRGISVAGVIVPALRTILAEHVVDADDLVRLLSKSAFVPEARLSLFVQGFLAGFRWDFCTALHILIPQIENALRERVESMGAVPRTIDGNGVEEVWSLERTLRYEPLGEHLGKRFLFELQTLLAGRLGPNLRNVVAHGLISPERLQGDTALYLWWVLLRLVLMPTPAMQAYLERQKAQGMTSTNEV